MNRGMSEELVRPRTLKRAQAGEAAPAESAGQLSVDGIEVTQVVQDMGHSVPLIAGKQAVVRVYLSRPAGNLVNVRGEISVRRVVATVNLTERSGEILYVNPVARALTPAESAGSGVEIHALDAQGQTLRAFPAPVKLNACADASQDRTGVIDAIIPAQPGARQLALVIEGQVADTFSVGGGAPAVSNLRRGEATEAALSFEWDAAAAAESSSNLTYNVQVSLDEGQTWQTVAVGLDSPDVSIDHAQFPPGSRVTVRVIATDGLTNTVADSETFSVDESKE